MNCLSCYGYSHGEDKFVQLLSILRGWGKITEKLKVSPAHENRVRTETEIYMCFSLYR